MSTFEFESGTLRCFYLYLCIVWRIAFACLMVCMCGMTGSDDDRGRSRRPGVKDRGWSVTSRVPGGRTIERSGDAVCDLHHA
jgi:hypothetical protein